MVGIRIESEKLKEIANILNLEEDEKKINVYLALINIGNGTLGQISSIVGLDYITTSNVLEDLNIRGFVKKIGVIPRYYCLEPFLISLVDSIDIPSNDAILELIDKRIENKQLSLIDKEEMFEDYIKKALNTKKNELIQDLNSEKSFNEEKLGLYLDNSVNIISKTAFDLIRDVEKNAKKMLKEIIRKDIKPVFHLIKEIHEKIDQIQETSRMLDFEEKEIPTDILFGESAVLSMMKDLILRTRSNLTILMPKPELQSIIIVSEQILSKRIKVTITGNLERVPKSMLNRLKSDSSIGSVQLRQSSEVNTWAVIKDNEEILFAPDVSSEDLMVGIWMQASLQGLEQLIQQFATQIRTMASKAQNIQI
ncbi:MAG: helix-turn-helix domain-containing protein [Candidatus Hodarchaeales archaeon]|jgi:sugar-specific transcriptional regulator TrmB